MDSTVEIIQSNIDYYWVGFLGVTCVLGSRDDCLFFLLSPTVPNRVWGKEQVLSFLIWIFEHLTLMEGQIKEENYERWKKQCWDLKHITSQFPCCTITCDIKITFPKVLISSPSHAWIGSESICNSSCFLFLRSWHCPYRSKIEHTE
jgi:hypothetical protein